MLDAINTLNNRVVDHGVNTPGWKEFANADEQSAIAWSFAAATVCGVDNFLPFETGFTSEDDDSASGEQIYESLVMSSFGKSCHHVGVTHLFHGGLLEHVKDFPVLAKWVQD
ncbi:hypothetical protein QT972_16585 [Microcoleus sp. herbarium7]|uniref:hypothetical protein n=1 Tax=Microcoleus sp. herbarium7 TaxID=3055435 RepID=UPI002FCFAFA7